jgi:hemerythrin
MLQWTEEFETGEPIIDSQHKLLVGYINQLEGMSHVTNPDRHEAEFLLNLVDFVENYTLVHFQHEEGCMARHHCPAHAENQAAHAEFLQFFRQFKLRFESEGCRAELLQQLHDYCCAWVRSHILRIDLQLKPCLRQASPEAKT